MHMNLVNMTRGNEITPNACSCLSEKPRSARENADAALI